MSLASALSKARSLLNPSPSRSSSSSSSEFTTPKTPSLLFPQVDPSTDGTDCLQDCQTCTATLPRKWEIDELDKLYGHVKGWDTHLIVATGKTDWVRDVTDEKGSLMMAVAKYKPGFEVDSGRVMMSASDWPTHAHAGGAWAIEPERDDGVARTRCLVMPGWWEVRDVGTGEEDVKWLVDSVLGGARGNASRVEKVGVKRRRVGGGGDGNGVGNEGGGEDVEGGLVPGQTEKEEEEEDALGLHIHETHRTDSFPQGVTMKKCPHRAVILMCSHGTRDWRCGKSAPILRREFERHLRPLGLYRDFDDTRPGGVGIYFINHVGGHKYSANVMIYRREGISTQTFAKEEDGSLSLETVREATEPAELNDEAVQGIWLARVRPEDCENIIRYTVLQGKLVKPQRQLRGGFDRERGVLSW